MPCSRNLLNKIHMIEVVLRRHQNHIMTASVNDSTFVFFLSSKVLYHTSETLETRQLLCLFCQMLGTQKMSSLHCVQSQFSTDYVQSLLKSQVFTYMQCILCTQNSLRNRYSFRSQNFVIFIIHTHFCHRDLLTSSRQSFWSEKSSPPTVLLFLMYDIVF